jgi:hypothetical protein
MVKIEANTDRSFLINGIPYQKGQYEISPLSDETQIKIVRVGSDTVLTKAALVDWVDAGDSPFADFAAFVLYTEPFFFRSVAGGGGSGVSSVTGDGVSGTATDVILTFPTSNEVDNDSLIPGANVTIALNELGVATSDNASDINTLQTNNTGTNTGDETTLSIQTKRPIKTVEGQSLEGIGDVSIDVGVISFNGRDGVVVSANGDYTTAQVTESTDKNYVTDSESTVIGNTSGTNTGDETTLSIQTKRPLKTVNSQSLEGVGNVVISGFDPAAEGVLTDYIDSQNNNQQTTNAVFPNLTTYLTLVSTGIDISSDYRFELSFSISINTTNRNAVVDIKDFGVSILPQVYSVEFKDITSRKWVTIGGRITPNPLGAGQIQLQLDFGSDQAATTTMYFANISLQKIN